MSMIEPARLRVSLALFLAFQPAPSLFAQRPFETSFGSKRAQWIEEKAWFWGLGSQFKLGAVPSQPQCTALNLDGFSCLYGRMLNFNKKLFCLDTEGALLGINFRLSEYTIKKAVHLSVPARIKSPWSWVPSLQFTPRCSWRVKKGFKRKELDFMMRWGVSLEKLEKFLNVNLKSRLESRWIAPKKSLSLEWKGALRSNILFNVSRLGLPWLTSEAEPCGFAFTFYFNSSKEEILMNLMEDGDALLKFSETTEEPWVLKFPEKAPQPQSSVEQPSCKHPTVPSQEDKPSFQQLSYIQAYEFEGIGLKFAEQMLLFHSLGVDNSKLLDDIEKLNASQAQGKGITDKEALLQIQKLDQLTDELLEYMGNALATRPILEEEFQSLHPSVRWPLSERQASQIYASQKENLCSAPAEIVELEKRGYEELARKVQSFEAFLIQTLEKMDTSSIYRFNLPGKLLQTQITLEQESLKLLKHFKFFNILKGKKLTPDFSEIPFSALNQKQWEDIKYKRTEGFGKEISLLSQHLASGIKVFKLKMTKMELEKFSELHHQDWDKINKLFYSELCFSLNEFEKTLSGTLGRLCTKTGSDSIKNWRALKAQWKMKNSRNSMDIWSLWVQGWIAKNKIKLSEGKLSLEVFFELFTPLDPLINSVEKEYQQLQFQVDAQGFLNLCLIENEPQIKVLESFSFFLLDVVKKRSLQKKELETLLDLMKASTVYAFSTINQQLKVDYNESLKANRANKERIWKDSSLGKVVSSAFAYGYEGNWL